MRTVPGTASEHNDIYFHDKFGWALLIKGRILAFQYPIGNGLRAKDLRDILNNEDFVSISRQFNAGVIVL